MALTSLPAGLFQTTSPRRHCSLLRPQAHTHIQRGLRTLRQSRRETLLSLPVKEPGLGSPGPDPKGPSGMLPLQSSAGDSFLWDSYCRLPFGGRQASEPECGERGWFLCRNNVWEDMSDAGYVQRLERPGQKVVRGPLANLLAPLGKARSGRAHTASHVILKASSLTLALIGLSILGTLQPEWSGSTASGRHQEGRRDSAR